MLIPVALLKQCGKTVVVKRNGTLNRFPFSSPEQGSKESLLLFRNALNGLAANCHFEGMSNTLVYDIFTSNMHNKAVQKLLCTEPKSSPEKALQLAVAFEDGLKR